MLNVMLRQHPASTNTWAQWQPPASTITWAEWQHPASTITCRGARRTFSRVGQRSFWSSRVGQNRRILLHGWDKMPNFSCLYGQNKKICRARGVKWPCLTLPPGAHVTLIWICWEWSTKRTTHPSVGPETLLSHSLLHRQRIFVTCHFRVTQKLPYMYRYMYSLPYSPKRYVSCTHISNKQPIQGQNDF